MATRASADPHKFLKRPLSQVEIRRLNKLAFSGIRPRYVNPNGGNHTYIDQSWFRTLVGAKRKLVEDVFNRERQDGGRQ